MNKTFEDLILSVLEILSILEILMILLILLTVPNFIDFYHQNKTKIFCKHYKFQFYTIYFEFFTLNTHFVSHHFLLKKHLDILYVS